MEVKAGYKQTEVGVVPEDWEVRPVGTMGDVRAGKALAARGAGQQRPYLRTKNVFDGRINLNDVLRMPMTEADFSRYRLRHGDVLLNEGQSLELVGRCAIYEDEYPEPCAIQNQLVRFRARVGVSAGFAAQLFRHCQKSGVFTRIALQTTSVAHLGVSRFHRLQLAWPPQEAEQDAIAEALSDADALIESLEQLLKKKRQLQQGAMQNLLTGKKRLPGFETNPGFKQTEVGAIPEDWEAKSLGDIGESLIGLTYKPTDVRSDGILVLRSSNIQEGSLCFDDNVFVDMEVPERIMVRVGDILICVRNGSRELIGKCALLDEHAKGMTFGAFMAVFRTPAYRFVHHQFQSAVLKRQIHEHLGATINQITNKSLNSFSIPLPRQKAEQEAIAEALSDMDGEIAALESQLKKARALKQGMLQEVLTGRIRLV
ncbi:MAG: restriction endonuclease subunit S [Acidobacteriia bacterium]|nr:restriction endonuclease subunit S [Terriglobia bacterium]